MQTIGVASSDAFPDSSFSASSSYSASYAPSKGRLNGNIAWAPNSNSDPNDYLQIDLLYEYVICAVATQGKVNEWTTKFKLQLSLDGTNFVTYQENNADKVGLYEGHVYIVNAQICIWGTYSISFSESRVGPPNYLEGVLIER